MIGFNTAMGFLALAGSSRDRALAVTPSCCSLSEQELDDMIGLADDGSSTYRILDNKCQDCDQFTAGLCRMNANPTICYTPTEFLESTVLRGYCLAQFGAPYPQSVGLEDKAIRSCVGKTQGDPPPTFDRLGYTPSCCKLTEKELDDMRGTGDQCPPTKGGIFIQTISNKCTKCLTGMCRLGTRYCYCAGEFLDKFSLGDTCYEEFGANYPATIDLEDKIVRSCDPPPELPGDAVDLNPPSPAAEAPSPALVEGTHPTLRATAPPTPNNPVNINDNNKAPSPTLKATDPPNININVNVNDNGENNEVKAAVIGGIISGVFGVLGVIVGIYCKKRCDKDSNEANPGP